MIIFRFLILNELVNEFPLFLLFSVAKDYFLQHISKMVLVFIKNERFMDYLNHSQLAF